MVRGGVSVGIEVKTDNADSHGISSVLVSDFVNRRRVLDIFQNTFQALVNSLIFQ